MPNPDAAPHTSVLETFVAAQTAATDATTEVGVAPEDTSIAACTFVPVAAASGATATKRTYTLTNKGAAGTGTTVLATFDGITGADLVAGDEKAFTVTATAADKLITAGDVIALVETHASTGTANPGGHLKVSLARR